jgi:membrane fusion protein (multidrug efflux system)
MASRWILALVTAVALACDDTNAPVETNADAEAQNAGLQSALRVRVAPVELVLLDSGESVTALVSADQRALLRAEVPGRVLERIAERGDRVETNAPLLRLDASRLELAQRSANAALASAQAELRQARRALERGRKLRAGDTISAAREDDLETGLERAAAQVELARVTRDQAARDLADAVLRAPFDGIVEDWQVDVGDFVQPATPIVTLVDLDRVRLRGGVTAAQASALRKGDVADALFSRLGRGIRPATLESVGVVSDPTTGTYEVEFLMDNPTGDLREGMVAGVRLPATAGSPNATIPRKALIRTPLGMAVFVLDESESPRARLQIVTLGRSDDDRVAVLDGLREGQRVVVEGQFALADGDPVALDSAVAP